MPEPDLAAPQRPGLGHSGPPGGDARAVPRVVGKQPCTNGGGRGGYRRTQPRRGRRRASQDDDRQFRRLLPEPQDVRTTSMISRSRFLHGACAMLAAAIVLPAAASAEEMVFASWGGAYQDAIRKAWIE